MRLVAIVVLLVACGRPGGYRMHVDEVLSHASHRQAPPGDGLAPKPWRVGQWTLYSIPSHSTYVEVSVVAQDSCGWWIEVVLQDPGQRWDYLLCFREQPIDKQNALELLQVTIKRWSSETATESWIVDYREPRNAARVRSLEQTWLVFADHGGGTAREDIDVPAGHFPRALHDNVFWTHPDVPISQIVRIGGGGDVELVSYGDGAPSAFPRLAEQIRQVNGLATPRSFFGIGISSGWVSSGGGEPSRSVFGVSLSLGFLVRPTLDIVSRDVIAGATESPTTSLATIGAGVRWSPFRRVRVPPWHGLLGASGLYSQLTAGYAELDRGHDTLGLGVAISPLIGWAPMRGRAWSFGIEASDDIAVLDRGQGVRHVLGFSSVIQLHDWP